MILAFKEQEKDNSLWPFLSWWSEVKVIAYIHHVTKLGISFSNEVYDEGYSTPLSTFSNTLVMHGKCIALRIDPDPIMPLGF